MQYNTTLATRCSNTYRQAPTQDQCESNNEVYMASITMRGHYAPREDTPTNHDG